MASPENKLLQTWFAPAFKAAGFTKSGATWHRPRSPFLHVFNIQGSQWSRYFYFNLGIYITELGPLPRPTIAHCHIQQRLDGIVTDRTRLIELSDFERAVPEEQRQSELQAAVSLYAIPWLDRMDSPEQVRQYIQSQKRSLPITVHARKYLGLPPA